MKDQLLSVAAYIESLEQRIAALEARCDSLENEIRQRPASVEEEPEVEVELIVDEETESVEKEVLEANAEESYELTANRCNDAANEESVEANAEESLEAETPQNPDQVEEKCLAPIVEDQPERVVENFLPSDSPKNKQNTPQQTSLFGAPVSDIRQAISIGDRFLFQRELFGGNGEAMQKLLERINACDGIGEAMDIVTRQNWDKESPTYELFVNVLRRRFQ